MGILKALQFNTPCGDMVAISDEKFLYFLEFVDHQKLEYKIAKLSKELKVEIIKGTNAVIECITRELADYFYGKLQEFKTPFCLLGTTFQQMVWQELKNIKYGETRSYKAQAIAIGHNLSYRAVANSNGANRLVIIIPCHRVINTNGNLGGYGGGIAKKRQLLSLEKQFLVQHKQ